MNIFEWLIYTAAAAAPIAPVASFPVPPVEPIRIPSGIYDIARIDTDPAAGIYANPRVAGVTLDSAWAVLEPSPGVFDWTALDARIAAAHAAGKQVMLGAIPGVQTPAWLYAQGARSLTITWPFTYNFPQCSTVRLPLPWGGTYLRHWTAFIAAFGAHYANDSRVVGIKVAGINAQTPEQLLPVATPTNCPAALSVPAAWASVGYRPSKLVAAWAAILKATTAAFPRTALVLQTGGWAFPGIDDAGQPTQPDFALTKQLAAQFVAAAGPRAVMENDGLSSFYRWPNPYPVPAGGQAAAPITGDASCRMNHFVAPCDPAAVLKATLDRAAGLAFVELYPGDLLNPALQP